MCLVKNKVIFSENKKQKRLIDKFQEHKNNSRRRFVRLRKSCTHYMTDEAHFFLCTERERSFLSCKHKMFHRRTQNYRTTFAFLERFYAAVATRQKQEHILSLYREDYECILWCAPTVRQARTFFPQ